MSIDRELLSRGLERLGLPPEGPLAEGLRRYGEEIELWNPAYGLVGAAGDEFVVKHLLDSLAPLGLLRDLLGRVAAGRAPSPEEAARTALLAPPSLRLADLGTGAGLPGIPLALALPGVRVFLVDRMGKRTRFLENEKAVLGLGNVEVVEREVERVDESFDLLTFRAFRPFERKLFKAVFALCEPDGFVAAYKGRRDKAQAELAAIEGLYASAEILPVEVPFLEDERCLVVLRPALRS
jgi:16S rRNA (guanine527-N7)-methyltransferase